MSDTLAHLAKENALLRDQLELFRREIHDPRMLPIETQGIHSGDQVICDSKSFGRVLGALIGPVDFVAEILSGDKPVSWVSTAARILIEPYACGSGKQSTYDSRTVTIHGRADDFLAMLPDDDLDCVIVNGIVYQSSPPAYSTAEGEVDALLSGSDAAMPLLREALRVSRKNVALICEYADPQPDFAPEKGVIRERGDCSSNCYPVDLAKHTIVLSRSISKNGGEVFRRFGVIIEASSGIRESLAEFRLVVVSELAANFEWSLNDIIVCDVEIANELARAIPRYRSLTIVPLRLLRSVITTPQAILRSSILNFAVLENYMRTLPTVVAQGTDAEFVVADLKAILAACPY